MAPHIEPEESLPDAVRRVAHESLVAATSALRGTSGQAPADVVHEVRKRTKRVRSLVRLVRPATGREPLTHEARTIRRAAQLLAPARDARVLVTTLDGVLATGSEAIRQRSFTTMRRGLGDRADALDEQIVPGCFTADAAAALLDEVDSRVDAWPLDDLRWKHLRKGILRTHRRGRRRMTDVADRGGAPHEWRKRAKDLLYQQQFIGIDDDDVDDLTDLLGEEHDLDVLSQFLAAQPNAEPLLTIADARRRELLDAALDVGARVYSDEAEAALRTLDEPAGASA